MYFELGTVGCPLGRSPTVGLGIVLRYSFKDINIPVGALFTQFPDMRFPGYWFTVRELDFQFRARPVGQIAVIINQFGRFLAVDRFGDDFPRQLVELIVAEFIGLDIVAVRGGDFEHFAEAVILHGLVFAVGESDFFQPVELVIGVGHGAVGLVFPGVFQSDPYDRDCQHRLRRSRNTGDGGKSPPMQSDPMPETIRHIFPYSLNSVFAVKKSF